MIGTAEGVVTPIYDALKSKGYSPFRIELILITSNKTFNIQL